jgi:hypothetical protein
LVLGSTGARLWADYLEEMPGFVGAIDFIHKVNIPTLFSVSNSSGVPASPADVQWRPSHATVRQSWGGLRLLERKFISWDDCAVSLQAWTNNGDSAIELLIAVDSDWMLAPDAAGFAWGERDMPNRQGLRLRAAVATDDLRLWSGLWLAPGEQVEIRVAAAVGVTIADSTDTLRARTTGWIGALPDDLLTRQISEYEEWFSAAPSFRSSDPLLDRTWSYRWFLLRHNLAHPGLGQLPGPTVYEGRSHKMTKTPWRPGGWEFSKLIPLSSPLQLMDARWYADPALGSDILAAAVAAQGPDGLLYSRTIDQTFSYYCNFLGWAAAEYAQLHGVDPVRPALNALKRQVRSELELRTPDADNLPVQTVHQRTGKEYQPSYWYFHGFPDDPKEPSTYTPLKRVDQAIYQHLNAAGVARLCAAAADPAEREFADIAAATATAVLSKQWDPDTGFFYDLHHETDAKALVRNVVGLYPWWAGITTDEHLDGFQDAFAADKFGTPWPLPSVSADCPVFAPAGGWNGQFLKGRNGCMWNGPTWPYTNSIALDAVGRTSRTYGHGFDGLFADLLHSYCLLHFQQHDGRTPYLVEHYDSRTGEPLSDEPDYLHSYLIDLIVRYVAGLTAAPDRIVVEPLDIGLTHFTLEGIVAAGHRISVTYQRHANAEPAGLTLTVDGAVVAHSDTLTQLSWTR